jgi:predicted amidohydrolase
MTKPLRREALDDSCFCNAIRAEALRVSGILQTAIVIRCFSISACQGVSLSAFSFSMTPFRIALANLRIPRDREDSVALVREAIAQAAAAKVAIIGFPECFVPGYRVETQRTLVTDLTFLERSWTTIAETAAQAGVAVVLGTERVTEGRRLLSALVIDREGKRLGFQDKVQLAPSEEAVYSAGSGRRVFQIGPAKVGIVICHEGWRYPETVRQAVRQGAQIVFHPHFDEDKPGAYKPGFADPTNTFHEKAMLCRAAENTCYFTSVNCAAAGSTTTSAIANPDGTLLAYQPYGKAGLLIADLDLDAATGYLASRYKPA